MSDLTTSVRYGIMRRRYWRAEDAFREVAVEEIRALIPPSAWGVVLDLNDTPRLAAVEWINEDGEPFDPYVYSYEEVDEGEGVDDTQEPFELIDTIASDLNVRSWEDAENFLLRTDDGTKFIITREV